MNSNNNIYIFHLIIVTMEEEKQAIFLIDNSIIPFERYGKPIEILDTLKYNASTKLIQEIGFDTINEQVGPYKIVGSSSKYLANIARLNTRTDLIDVNTQITGEEKEEILFSGTLAIYKTGLILGTDISGNELFMHNKIWVAKSPEKKFYNSEGLKTLLFDSANRIERIESIIRGYEIIQEKIQRNKEAYENSIFDSGRQNGIYHSRHH
ncbi:MAG: hypothetical protein ACP5NV_02745 [Candidatus Woesearchaeota archaeon]